MLAPQIASRAIALVDTYDIQDADDAEMGSQELFNLSRQLKEMDEKRVFLKAPSLEAGRRIDDFFREPIATISAQIVRLRSKLGVYVQRVEDQRLREEDEERQRQRDEREKSERIAREKEIEAGAAELEGRDADAERLAAEAEKHRDVAEAPVVRTVATTPVRVAGLSSSKPWKGEVTDVDALFMAAAEHPHLRSLFKVDASAVNALAKATKSAKAFPGLRFFQETKVATFGGRR
jgi:hypothetical protein